MKAATLAEHRLEVLRLAQAEVARLASCSQALVSRVERGWEPKRKWTETWKGLLRAYRLDERAFLRLIRAARAAAALKRPHEDDLPLFRVQGSEFKVARLADETRHDQTSQTAVG